MDDENGVFKVVANDRGQHSIWPAGRDCPSGWVARNFRGTRTECLEWIQAAWPIGQEIGGQPTAKTPLGGP